METIRSIIHAIGLFLSTVLDPVIVVLNGIGNGARKAMDGMKIPTFVQPVGVIALWFIVILLLIRFLKGATRITALLAIALLLLRIYRVLPDI